MNVILVPGNAGNAKSSSLPHRYLVVILLAGGVFLPVFLGFITYRIQAVFYGHNGAEAKIAAYSQHLAQQTRALELAKEETATHLNALTWRLGQMQAQMLRLNALGGRLSQMAGLDANEFNFTTEVGQGGPEVVSQGGTFEVGASLRRMGEEMRASEARLSALEAMLLQRRVTDAGVPTGWPTDGGFVSSRFGDRADPFSGSVAFHEGVDIASQHGAPIKAMADGIVSFAGEKANYGRVVEITHGNNLITRYAHTLSVLVKEGQVVARGDVIGLIGSSGRSTGPHVHIEVLRDGKPVDPVRYLRSAR